MWDAGGFQRVAVIFVSRLSCSVPPFIQSGTLAHVLALSAFRVNLLSSVKPSEVRSQTQPKCASLISYVFLNQVKLMIRISRHTLSLARKGVDFSTSMYTLVIACHFDYSCAGAWQWYLFVIPTWISVPANYSQPSFRVLTLHLQMHTPHTQTHTRVICWDSAAAFKLNFPLLSYKIYYLQIFLSFFSLWSTKKLFVTGSF